MAKMSTSDLKAMLASEKADALAALSAARLAEERADAMDYYLGDMRKDMPAQDGRSRAVSTDVADTIEGLMPSLMDIFAGSDEVVRFEPVGPEDEAAATAAQQSLLAAIDKSLAAASAADSGIASPASSASDSP